MASGNWSNEETFKLIELWGDDRIQAQLEGCKRNKNVYKKIAGRMVEAGHEKTAEQCREKEKKLKAEYRKVKDSQNRSGAGRKSWKYLHAMDAVLGDKPATRPQVIVDILETATEMSQDPEGGRELRKSSVTTNPILACSEECHQEQALSYFDSNQDHSSQPSNSASIASTPTLEKKGKKRNRDEQLERAMMNVEDRIVSAQEASDVKFFELEEKNVI